MPSVDAWKYLKRENTQEAIRCRHCRGCIYLGACAHMGCCNYWEKMDRLRLCPPGRGCTVKIISAGYQFEPEWDELVRKYDRKEDEQKRREQRKKHAAEKRRADKQKQIESDQITPYGSCRGKKCTWDVEYAHHLYNEGYYVWEIAEIMDLTFYQVRNYADRHEWHLKKTMKPLCRHDVDEARIVYSDYLREKERKAQVEQTANPCQKGA